MGFRVKIFVLAGWFRVNVLVGNKGMEKRMGTILFLDDIGLLMTRKI